MKHNIIPKALRCLAAAGLCLAAAACSKDDITPEPAPQQGITPTKIIFNVSRFSYLYRRGVGCQYAKSHLGELLHYVEWRIW